ncbi:MAG: hypothetical protein ACHP6H_02615 [Legionellales bacterium]
MKLFIYLNAQGTAFTIKRASGTVVTKEKAISIHPVIAQLISATNQIEVLNALSILQKIAKKVTPVTRDSFFQNNKLVESFDSYIIESTAIQFSLMHMNTAYEGHRDITGAAHHESLEKMIDFVGKKDLVRQSYFESCVIS